MDKFPQTDPLRQGARPSLLRRLRSRISPKLLPAMLAVLLIVALYAATGCPILYFTGISCPGCGMTRACLALARLDFAAAAGYHPMVFALPLVAALAFVRIGPLANKKLRTALALALVVLLLAVYIYRLFFSDGSVVRYGFPPFWEDIKTILGGVFT